MMQAPTHSRAPFAPGGGNPIDAATCERLLAVALSKGGDYADLFFEYRAASSLAYDEGILKAASRGVSVSSEWRCASLRSRPIGASIVPLRERGRPTTSARYSLVSARTRTSS